MTLPCRHRLVQVGVGAGVGEPVPVNPNAVLAPAAIVPFQEVFRTVTLLALVASVPSQSWLMVCPLGSVQPTVHALIAAGVGLATVTSAWKPPCQLLAIWCVAVHPREAVGAGDGAALPVMR
jgi:hypothetical protein